MVSPRAHAFNDPPDTINLAIALDEDEQAKKEAYLEEGFPDWSRRDFQQFVRALEANGWWARRIYLATLTLMYC